MNYQYGFQTLTLNVERKCLTTCTYMIELLFKCQKRWDNFSSYILYSTCVFAIKPTTVKKPSMLCRFHTVTSSKVCGKILLT